jgi:hypothetical protein
MKTLDMEAAVVADLRNSAMTILEVLDRDAAKALSGDADVITSLNVNLRVVAAINEVLLYYGDSGVFKGKA